MGAHCNIRHVSSRGRGRNSTRNIDYRRLPAPRTATALFCNVPCMAASGLLKNRNTLWKEALSAARKGESKAFGAGSAVVLVSIEYSILSMSENCASVARRIRCYVRCTSRWKNPERRFVSYQIPCWAGESQMAGTFRDVNHYWF